jgi:23S rRNA (cytosine1962-C5)-methyltransferase
MLSMMPRPQRPPRIGFRPLRWIAPAFLAEFDARGTNAHRLATGEAGWVERLGCDLLISYREKGAAEALCTEALEWSAVQGLTVQRVFGRYLPKHNDERDAPDLIQGDAAAPLQTVVHEAGFRFGIDFAAGYSTGLFLDQRANRAALRTSGVKRLLNTFSYTCSFSVVAAAAGAETVSVDLSKRSIERGRRNFVLNEIDPAGHRFLVDDVMDVLPRLARRGELFDAIVVDPPTFSRGNRGRKFQAEEHLSALLQAAMEVAAKDARILLSTNCARIDARELDHIARVALKSMRRGGQLHREPDLPDIPAQSAARTVWILCR